MKKIKFKKKLSLDKRTVSNLSDEEIKGVKGGLDIPTFANGCTGGCTDGCLSGLLHSKWNCTEGGCTSDCCRS